ncbi:MAG TPA: zf-HC2 domain-containing protein [Pyrinomonadaceae bacterium]|jgi:hypothetical protein
MQHEFDNTFESLLRRVATRNGGEVLPENAAHLDADSISAFAENALPDTTRARFTAHLADCSDCRQILVNFASIQEAEESEIVETQSVSPAQPTWSERFTRWFALPNLGYAAAALTVLFVGVFAFVAFQSQQQKPAEIAVQIETETEEEKAEKKLRSTRTQPVQPEPTIESTPEVLPDAANLADLGNANSAENSNQNADQSPNRGLPPSYRVIQGQAAGTETARQREPESPRESNRPANTSNSASGGSANTLAAQPTPTANVNPPNGKTAAPAAPSPANQTNVEEKASGEAATQVAGSPALDAQNNQARPAAPLRNTVAGRSVGGKTFQNLDGVWRDPAYNGQTTVMVARGSDEYKKLDGGLRSIAESFRGETVIIVWQGKAYRIR